MILADEMLRGMKIPIKNRDIWCQLFEDIVQYRDTIDRLQLALDTFSSRLEISHKTNEFLNRELAVNLLAQSQAALRLCRAEPKADFVSFLLASVSYFICEEDAVPDFEGIDGLEDDKILLKATISYFQLEDRIAAHLEGGDG